MGGLKNRKVLKLILILCRRKKALSEDQIAEYKPQQLLFVQKETGGKTIDMI